MPNTKPGGWPGRGNRPPFSATRVTSGRPLSLRPGFPYQVHNSSLRLSMNSANPVRSSIPVLLHMSKMCIFAVSYEIPSSAAIDAEVVNPSIAAAPPLIDVV